MIRMGQVYEALTPKFPPPERKMESVRIQEWEDGGRQGPRPMGQEPNDEYQARVAAARAVWTETPPGRLNTLVGDRVYPVVVPDDKQDFPAIVFARAGGGQVATLRGKDSLPLIRLDFIARGYETLEEMHALVVAALRRADMLYLDPDEVVDLWDDELDVYRQQVHVVVQSGDQDIVRP